MKFLKLTNILLLAAMVMLPEVLVGGQNADAKFYVDIEVEYPGNTGNQNVTHKEGITTGDYVWIDLYAGDVSNFDAYQFRVDFDPNDLNNKGFTKNKSGFEENILGSDLTVSGSQETDYQTVGVTANGDQTDAEAPDGSGYLGYMLFEALVDNPKGIKFSNVQYVDNNGDGDYLSDSNVDQEATFGGGALPVELSSFEAIYDNNHVSIKWSTESELNAWGFNVFRSQTKENGYKKLNADIIEASGTTTTPQQYSYIDERVESGQTYFYKLQQVDVDGSNEFYGPVKVSIASAVNQATKTPKKFRLYENFPNPFNPTTMITYDLAHADDVDLKIYNISGRLVRNLLQTRQSAGQHSLIWNGLNERNQPVPSGTYFCILQTSQQQFVTKMTLLR